MLGILFIAVALATALAFLRWCEVGLDLYFSHIAEMDERDRID